MPAMLCANASADTDMWLPARLTRLQARRMCGHVGSQSHSPAAGRQVPVPHASPEQARSLPALAASVHGTTWPWQRSWRSIMGGPATLESSPGRGGLCCSSIGFKLTAVEASTSQ